MEHGHRRGRGWPQPEAPAADDAADWFAGRLPDDWFAGRPHVSIDREEIVIVGTLPPLSAADSSTETETGTETESGAGDEPTAAVEAGRIARFREETRDRRIGIAREAEARYGRKVAWGAQLGSTTQLFSTAAVPVMTRLRQPDRQVLDTLVDSGVARSRAEALAWCVRLVGQHTESWLGELREAMSSVDAVRTRGPQF